MTILTYSVSMSLNGTLVWKNLNSYFDFPKRNHKEYNKILRFQ